MGGCVSSSGPSAPAFVLNMEAEPTARETSIWTKMAALLAKAPTHIQNLSEYKGCDAYIKNALADPTPESEAAAWKAVQKAVDHLHKFYTYSLSLEESLPELLNTICSLEAGEGVQTSQALIKQLAEVFDFAFHFDELKMVNPAIQNDFSYYRRVLSRMRNSGTSKKSKSSKNQVNEEVANKMSFHYAYPTPVMKVLIATVVQMPNSSNLIPGLVDIANVAISMMEAGTEDTAVQNLLFCLMTGCVIFIDHLDPSGVFHKKSPVRIRQCVTILKNSPSAECLMNSLRFSTLHLKDETVMPAVAKLFE